MITIEELKEALNNIDDIKNITVLCDSGYIYSRISEMKKDGETLYLNIDANDNISDSIENAKFNRQEKQR